MCGRFANYLPYVPESEFRRLHPADYDDRLDPSLTGPADLRHLLKPYPAAQLYAYPVSDLVGNVRDDDPRCVESLK